MLGEREHPEKKEKRGKKKEIPEPEEEIEEVEESEDEGEDPALDSLSQAIAFQVFNSSFSKAPAIAPLS